MASGGPPAWPQGWAALADQHICAWIFFFLQVGEKLAARDFLERRWSPVPQCPFTGCSQRRVVVDLASAGRQLSPGTGMFLLPLKGLSSPTAPKTAPRRVPSPGFAWRRRNFLNAGAERVVWRRCSPTLPEEGHQPYSSHAELPHGPAVGHWL